MSYSNVARNAVLWALVFTVGLMLFLTYGARPLLHVIGLVFGLMGGPGLEGTGL